MGNIIYEKLTNETTVVYLDGKIVGKIKTVKNGYQYFPKGKRVGGDIFPTMLQCKASLED